MNSATHQHPAALADVDFTSFKRVAADERAEAVKQVGRAIAAWLRSGLKLRFTDDAVTHPAAGKLCGC